MMKGSGKAQLIYIQGKYMKSTALFFMMFAINAHTQAREVLDFQSLTPETPFEIVHKDVVGVWHMTLRTQPLKTFEQAQEFIKNLLPFIFQLNTHMVSYCVAQKQHEPAYLEDTLFLVDLLNRIQVTLDSLGLPETLYAVKQMVAYSQKMLQNSAGLV